MQLNNLYSPLPPHPASYPLPTTFSSFLFGNMIYSTLICISLTGTLLTGLIMNYFDEIQTALYVESSYFSLLFSVF